MIAILSAQHEISREQRIREAFADNQMSLSSFTHFLAEAGFWGEDENGSFVFKAQISEVRSALKTRGDDRLPFAGPTSVTDDDGAPMWTQRRFWRLEDYGTNIKEYRKQIRQRSEVCEAMTKEAVDRFGFGAVENEVGETLDVE